MSDSCQKVLRLAGSTLLLLLRDRWTPMMRLKRHLEPCLTHPTAFRGVVGGDPGARLAPLHHRMQQEYPLHCNMQQEIILY